MDNNESLLLALIGILMLLVAIKELFSSVNQPPQDIEPITTENKDREVKKEDIKKEVKIEPKQEVKPAPKHQIKKADAPEINKKKFLENQKFLENNDKDNPLYIKVLFETGLLYEKLYKDYFRGACYLYLTTLMEPSNEEYEKQYIRLCKIVREKNGVEWEYYVTLIHDISDIEKYIDELLNKGKEKKKIQKPKPVVVKPTPKPIYSKPKIVQKSVSKFEEFNTESYLHSLGYKVGATGLSEYQRRRLLKRVLDEGKISKYDVIETLERNISMFGHRSDRQKAVSDWRSDLRYIKENF